MTNIDHAQAQPSNLTSISNFQLHLHLKHTYTRKLDAVSRLHHELSWYLCFPKVRVFYRILLYCFPLFCLDIFMSVCIRSAPSSSTLMCLIFFTYLPHLSLDLYCVPRLSTTFLKTASPTAAVFWGFLQCPSEKSLKGQVTSPGVELESQVRTWQHNHCSRVYESSPMPWCSMWGIDASAEVATGGGTFITMSVV